MEFEEKYFKTGVDLLLRGIRTSITKNNVTYRGRVSIFHKCYSKPYLFSLSNFAPDSFVDPSPLRYT